MINTADPQLKKERIICKDELGLVILEIREKFIVHILRVWKHRL